MAAVRTVPVDRMVKEYHVEPRPDGRWHLRRENAEKPFAFYPSRAAAESAARVLAQHNEGVVAIHETEGAPRRTDYRGRPLG